MPRSRFVYMIAWLLVYARDCLGGLRSWVGPAFPIGFVSSVLPVFVAPPVITKLARCGHRRCGFFDRNNLKQHGGLAGGEFEVQRSVNSSSILVVDGEGFFFPVRHQGRD